MIILTDEQLEDLKVGYLQNKKPIVAWIRDKGSAVEGLRPRQARRQLMDKYGEGVIQDLTRNANPDFVLFPPRVNNIIDRYLGQPEIDVAKCDVLIAELNAALTKANDKKTELS